MTYLCIVDQKYLFLNSILDQEQKWKKKYISDFILINNYACSNGKKGSRKSSWTQDSTSSLSVEDNAKQAFNAEHTSDWRSNTQVITPSDNQNEKHEIYKETYKPELEYLIPGKKFFNFTDPKTKKEIGKREEVKTKKEWLNQEGYHSNGNEKELSNKSTKSNSIRSEQSQLSSSASNSDDSVSKLIDDKMKRLEDAFQLKMGLMEKENKENKDALQKRFDMLEQEKMQKDGEIEKLKEELERLKAGLNDNSYNNDFSYDSSDNDNDNKNDVNHDTESFSGSSSSRGKEDSQNEKNDNPQNDLSNDFNDYNADPNYNSSDNDSDNDNYADPDYDSSDNGENADLNYNSSDNYDDPNFDSSDNEDHSKDFYCD
ncbi:hypothetical protein K501DRAFT_275721 [Backusella circina FSU 941]|nr:hypothetical protein K501DRAFT_275721 [Backusella circina FSU 941]